MNVKKSIDEDGNPISVWNPDEPETDSDGKGRVSQVELFYSNGDICDITGEPREVIVRLKVIKIELINHHKVRCAFLLVVVSMLPQSEIGRNGHGEGEHHFTSFVTRRYCLNSNLSKVIDHNGLL